MRSIIAKVLRPHGLKGGLVLGLENSRSLKILGAAALFIDDTAIEVQEIFGVIKDNCRVFLRGYINIDEVQQFRDAYIEAEGDFQFEDPLIGMKLMVDGKIIASITNVHNFGAGKVIETDLANFPNMFSITDVDIYDDYVCLKC